MGSKPPRPPSPIFVCFYSWPPQSDPGSTRARVHQSHTLISGRTYVKQTKLMDGESNATFPAADAEGSLDPSRGNDVRVDPISAEVADLKEQAEVAEIKGEEDKCTCDGLKTLKRAVVISAVVVAVGGAALVVARKLKEK